MKKFTLAMLLVFCSFVAAQTKDPVTLETIDSKLDTVITMQQKTYMTIRNNPLENKNYGVEANLVRLLYAKDEYFSASGTVSFFNIDRRAELAFPIFYSNTKSSDNDIRESFRTLTIDCHYRYFLGSSENVQNGFYISALTRYAHLYGTLGSNDFFWNGNTKEYKKDSENKLGIGFGIGYRIFSKNGFYWGCSLSAGRYLLGKNNRFTGDFFSLDDDNENFLDVELLKFGWAF